MTIQFMHHSIKISRPPTSNSNEDVTLVAVIPLNLASAGNGPSLEPAQQASPVASPAPAYTEHDLGGVGRISVTPPPSYTESNSGVIVGESKTVIDAHGSPIPSTCHGINPNHDCGGSVSISDAVVPSLGEMLCDPYGDNDATGLDTMSAVPELIPSYCATNSIPGPEDLNYHVNSNNGLYRWKTTKTSSIPVGIDISSFESYEQGLMAQRCLITVLDRFNVKNVGPKFQFVSHPFHSAFFVRFGGDYPIYARAFFPGSLPEYWYIDIFKPGLTLSAEQEEFLMRTGAGDTAKLQALEQNLIKILTHEMLHVVGVRHCDAQVTEKAEKCVRFPPDLSDDENNEEHLMQRFLDWKSLSQLDWMDRTIQEIRQIYAMKDGEYIGCHRIQDVSWEDGARRRMEIARRNALCCGVWLQHGTGTEG
ncbi:hypothetical protein Daus18300_011635 [Diaporthe australafricana]|uniref:Uncharacterized protein n=1 Tax=Diaporthe australafricana TaxID=127596 RepID=A0ABR3W5R4_9PEZI